ncbi:MAG TPA: DUF4058 family protein [Isosphaeraceae bacterium]|nr:DUF4058 family protein [Isosphaeraceae bacterium]
MTGPFPGMDPYLEAQGLWESFHAALVTHCAEALNQNLPEGYVAQIETRVALVSLEIPSGQRIPDVLVGREPNAPRFPSSSSGGAVGAATIEPMTIPLARGEVEIRERWIEISSLPELELVTVIEILSPSNKSGSGRSEYLQKRDALIDQPVNLVEIDLLVGGRPMPMGKNLPAGHYLAIVARAANRPDAKVYAWTIRHALPPIPIPLRAPDADVRLDLDQPFDLTYRLGRFDRIVRHGSPLPGNLPLTPADREWAEAQVR